MAGPGLRRRPHKVTSWPHGWRCWPPRGEALPAVGEALQTSWATPINPVQTRDPRWFPMARCAWFRPSPQGKRGRNPPTKRQQRRGKEVASMSKRDKARNTAQAVKGKAKRAASHRGRCARRSCCSRARPPRPRPRSRRGGGWEGGSAAFDRGWHTYDSGTPMPEPVKR